jgi:hypothetical protein
MSALTPTPVAAPSQAMRPPERVMRLARMGASHPTRLSFMNALLRRIKSQGWRFERREWALNAQGVGHAVYTVYGPERSYSLVAFSHDLPPEMRSDRVIASAWDATFTLFDGIPSASDISRLRVNVPLQEAGRISDTELTLARANRSVRLWESVVSALAAGQQPDMTELARVGYLMRTTAVYGSGKFGAADRNQVAQREELAGPFRAEMLTVWLIRAFTFDCVAHLARVKGGERAVTLSAENCRRIGVGNSTGLGMAPFLMNHPALLHQWIACRETALARVRAVERASAQAQTQFLAALSEATRNASEWCSEHPLQTQRIAQLRADLDALHAQLHAKGLRAGHPWDALMRWSETALSLEGQEQLVALMLEPYGELIDDLADCMGTDESASFDIDGAMTLDALSALLLRHYHWIEGIDFSVPSAQARFWYVSQEKLEPRLGERLSETGADLELPLATARDVHKLQQQLASATQPHVAAFLLAHPEHRFAVRRVQLSAKHPYAEIQDNLIDARVLPMDLLRCKLAFFGASKFDPRSDRWVRISMYQGASLPQDICLSVPARLDRDPCANVRGPVHHGGQGSETVTSYSLPEIEALSKRAARGAGLSWGLAEEAGKAARWLHAHGQPGTSALASLLQAHDGCAFEQLCPQTLVNPWRALSGQLCPLITGAALLDHANLHSHWPITLQAVSHPLLLAPFVARAARLGGCVMSMAWAGVTITIDADGQVVCAQSPQQATALHDHGPQTVTLTRQVQRPPLSCDHKIWPHSHWSQSVSAPTWQVLETLAYRTLVPASASSRAGAGAATGDND